MKIARKLPLIMVGLTAINVFAVTFLQQNLMYKETIRSTEKELSAYQEAKKTDLQGYLQGIHDDLIKLSSNDYIRAALRDFNDGWLALDGEQTKQLQDLYIDKNPNPAGQKEKLDAANDGSLYSMVHAKYHPWMRKFLQTGGYHDVFLFNANGDLIYSVFKERDFATNMNAGEWKDTDLANAFRAARDNPKLDHIVFQDFKAYSPSGAAAASFIASPVLGEDGRLLGVLAFQIPITKINDIITATDGLGKTSAIYLVGADHLMRTDHRLVQESTILKMKLKGEIIDKALVGESGNYAGIDPASDTNVISSYTPFEFHGTKWAMITEISEKEVMSSFHEIQRISIICSLAILFIIALISVWYSKCLTKPIAKMVDTMKMLADGNNEVSVPSLERRDEIGDMAKAVQVFKENALEMERMEAEAEKSKVRIEQERQASMARLADDFDNRTSSVIMALTSASQQMQQTAERMTDASERTSEISSAVAAAATQADANVQTVAVATEQLSASSREIAQQINMVASMANNASDEAESTSAEVKNLQEMAVSIGEVVGAIKEIAEQTNLLALNATIEAARAGEAGKGFAVVADEVKKLANETAQKTEEIDSRVSAIQAAINSSVAAMDKIIGNVKKIDQATTSVTAAVEEQNAATGEIGRNVSEASSGTQQVSENIVSVQEKAFETGEESKTVLHAAAELARLSAELQEQVSGFLCEIRNDSRKGGGKQKPNLTVAAE
ncbi:MAG TPA: methyl-accepting chemotaxis protein [Micavibrio sp.]|nr:methyl-accepting chemotaxis protein [Micavibrio sp.]